METDESDFLRESVKQLLNKRNDQVYPDIHDGVTSWSLTVDRLSKKVASQRHDIFDLQHKLRLEAEKNRDLSKIIHADRKQYREVISALTSKIEKLELRGVTAEVHAKPHAVRPLDDSPQSLPATEGRKEEKNENNTALITELTARLVSVQAECDRLMQARPKSPEPDASGKPAQFPENREDVEASRSTSSADLSAIKELRMIIDQNNELKAMIKSQATELKLLKQRHEESRQEPLRVVRSQSKESLPRKSMTIKRSHELDHLPSVPNTHSTLTSIDFNETGAKSDDAESHSSTAESIQSSPQPLKHNSAHFESSESDLSTVASSTSTPPLKSSAALFDRVGHRLDKLRDQLDRDQLSRIDLKNFEEAYRLSSQILEERPQLLKDTKTLVEKLQNGAPLKHARLLSRIGEVLC